MDASKITIENPKTDDTTVDIDMQEDEHGWRIAKTGDMDFVFRRKDPYGMWVITSRKGKLPNALEGLYTSVDECKRALALYMHAQDKVGIINKNHRKKLGLDPNG